MSSAVSTTRATDPTLRVAPVEGNDQKRVGRHGALRRGHVVADDVVEVSFEIAVRGMDEGERYLVPEYSRPAVNVVLHLHVATGGQGA